MLFDTLVLQACSNFALIKPVSIGQRSRVRGWFFYDMHNIILKIDFV